MKKINYNLYIFFCWINYDLYLKSLGSFGIGLDSGFHFNLGATNVTVTISLFYKIFLQKSIYVIVVLAHICFLIKEID